MPDKASYVFISYAPKDNHFALWLYDLLKREGIPAWIDSRDVPAGSAWDEAVKKALDAASHVILVNSRTSVLTPYIRDDWNYALKKGAKVIMLLIDKAGLPLLLQRAVRVNFHKRDEAEASAELLDLLRPDFPQLSDGLVSEANDAKVEAYSGETALDDESLLKQADMLRRENRFNEAATLYCAALTGSKRAHIRVAAVCALGELRAQNDSVLDMLQDPVPEVRQEAAIALARIGSQRARLPLQLAAVQDSSITVRLYAALAMMTYEARDAIPAWLNELAAASTDPAFNEALSLVQLRVNDLLNIAPHHIFISYARRDSEQFTIDLAANLRGYGFSVWVDTNLEAGTSVWVHEIEKAIQQAGVCVVILSPAIHQSEWVPKEVEFARQFNKKIIPIKFAETHKPLYLSTEQGLRPDHTFQDEPEKMLTALVVALDKLVTRTR